MRQNEKALILALISFLLLNRLCPKSAPEHIIKGQTSPDPTIFTIFLWEILPRTSKCPETPLLFIIFVGKYCPEPHKIWLRLPRTHYILFDLTWTDLVGVSSPSSSNTLCQSGKKLNFNLG